MNRWQIDCKDVMTWCKEYDGPKFHALVADPPYELNFMGRDWDRSGIAFRSKTWAALSEHLLQGAFIFVFGSSRGWHRLACAIEDAGFVFHPSLMVWGWVQGTGFPKATRIDTQIDRAAGKSEERKTATHPIAYPDSDCWGVPNRNIGNTTHIWGRDGNRPERGQGGMVEYTEPATPLACTWEGHRYGRQALKPAVEMIICAQKPYEGRPIDSIMETGAGVLWIDGARIGTTRDVPASLSKRKNVNCYGDYGAGHPKELNPNQGRWPPNFALCHVPPHICATCDGSGCDACGDTGLVGGCRRVGTKRVKRSRIEKPCDYQGDAGLFGNDGARPARGIGDPNGYEETAAWNCCEECAARRIGEQSGESRSNKRKSKGHGDAVGLYGMSSKCNDAGVDDTGTAARFFPQFGWAAEIAERLANSDQVRYCAKASRSEREAGLDALPSSLPDGYIANRMKCRTIRMKPIRNPHSTIKPISLVKWLAILLLPPPEYAPRRILVPFCGVASEMIAASLAGWEFVHGIEMSEEYCKIGEARLAWWLRQLQLPEMEGMA